MAGGSAWAGQVYTGHGRMLREEDSKQRLEKKRREKEKKRKGNKKIQKINKSENFKKIL